MIAPILMFLKAKLPGNAADLFAMPVQVAAHTTKEGTFVGPHQAIRHKRAIVTPVPAPMAHPDLFSAPAQSQAAAKPVPAAHPDLFFIPLSPHAAANPPELPIPGTETRAGQAAADVPAAPPVPQGVRDALSRAIASLRDVANGLAAGRQGDRQFGGQGRYETDAMANLAGQREQAEAVVAKFRTAAGKMGVDADATLAELGGLPDLTPSAFAVAYGAAKVAHAAAASKPTKPATADPLPSAPEPTRAGFGVPAGTEKKDRLKLNAAARDLLASKSDADMTDADKAVLRQYTGTGTIGDSANEFYTPPEVAAAVWTLLNRAGFRGGDVLEPSAGTGVFAHTAPKEAQLTTVEMDPTSSRICGILHPGADNRTSTLERYATQDCRQFDAVVGNPPYGARGDVVRDDKKDLPKAELYFADTALDKLKSGGLCALVLPSGFMDASSNRSFRAALLRKAEFLGASRLPNTAFEAAHTQVTTDVVLFRKRPQDVAGALGTLSPNQVEKLGISDAEFVDGQYFNGRGAGNINGTLEPGWREKAGMGHDITCAGSMIGVPDAVESMPIETPAPGPDMHAILDELDDDPQGRSRALGAALRPPYLVAKPGDVKVVDGVSYILQGDPPRWHLVEQELHPSVHDALRVAESLADLETPVSIQDAGVARAGLIEDLDAHVAAYGIPSRNKHLRAWLSAPSMPNVGSGDSGEHARKVHDAAQRAARLLGAVNPDGTYSDLVTGEARGGATADLDTTALKLSLELGGFTAAQLAERAGAKAADVEDHLFASPGYALDPDGRTWFTMDAYTSGEMWPKLDAARAAAAGAKDPALAARWNRQADALEAAIAPQSLDDVEITLSAGFVSPEDLTAWFLARRTEWDAANPGKPYGPGTPVFAYSDVGAVWTAKDVGNGDGQLVLDFLNRTGVKKDDRPRLDRIQGEFATWLRGSPNRDAVEERYNRTYRGFRAPTYSENPIEIPGLNPGMSVNPYQFAGLRWAMEVGSGIIAADTGVGKTPRGLMLNVLLKATGTARKPVIVVPKSVLANWKASAEQWFPGARILIIGETYKTDKAGKVTSKADTAAMRQEKYHQLQQNDFDFVFMSQPAWNDLDVSPERKAEMQSGEFWNRRADSLEKASSKKVAQAKIRHDQDMAERDFKDREASIYFDDLGIDTVIIDEGQAYKNLFAAKNRFGDSPKFLGGSSQSARAQDTYFKTKVIRDANAGKGVFMLSATPTKNSPLEVYSMLSHIAPEAFERMGIKNSEAFLDRFCEFEEQLILSPKGEMVDALVTSGFKNLPELREVMRRYIDRKTAADVGLVIPRGEPHDHYVDMTPEQENAYVGLRESFGGGDKAGSSHAFSIMHRMGLASIDLTMLTGGNSVEHMPKVDKCVEMAVQGAEEGGQLIFCDHNDMHERIADKLVAAGVPRTQIGVLNAEVAASGADRQRICDRFNRGDLRYVIGNTPTMGEGVNLQVGTTDIHHLDLPWDPSTMQQRNGRGVRQGNKRLSVRLHTYLAKRSFDGYRAQTIRAKKDWMDLLWNGADRVENLAAQGKFSKQEQMILFAADPDAARAKFDGDKTAAMERKAAADRGTAIDAFNRLNRMGVSLSKLRKDVLPGGVPPVALQRLEAKHAQAREALAAMPGFEHPDLLDSPAPAVIQPTTGHAWTAGRGMVIDGGEGSPIQAATAPTRWMVTEVDPNEGTVTARPYGALATTLVKMKLASMNRGVTPFDASPAHEGKMLDAAGITPGADGVQKMKLQGLRNLPEDVLQGRQKQVEARMRHAIVTGEDSPPRGQDRTHYGVIGSEGAYLARTDEIARLPAEHRLMLPLPEHKDAAIRAYVQEGMNRRLKTEQPSGRGRNRFSYSQPEEVKPVYQNGVYGTTMHPWKGPIGSLFGPKAQTEAHAALHQAALDGIKAAPNFRDAMVAAQATYDPGHRYGAELHATRWPRDVVMHLAAKAKELGVLDRETYASVRQGISMGLARDLHSHLFVHAKKDFAAQPYYASAAPKVREFLAAIAHPDDAKAINQWERT